jgi:putative ABC transport system permease protein
MRVLKRASIKIWKKKGTSVLLLSIMILLFTVTLACKMIQRSVDNSAESAKSDVKATVKIGYDDQKLMMAGTSEVFLNLDLIEKLKKSQYVSEVTGTIEVSVNGDYQPVQEGEGAHGGGQIMGDGGAEINMDSLCGSVVSLDNKENSHFATGDNELIEGIYPFDSDLNNAIIISDEFAKQNKLSIGSKMKILGILAKKDVTLEIVGIYRTHVKSEADDFIPFLAEKNRFYASLETAIEAQTAGVGSNAAEISSILVTLNNPNDIETFIASIENDTTIDSQYFRFSSDLDKYKTVTSSIQKVAEVARVLSIIASILATCILGLIMILVLRDRKYEIGVLLSLGEKKTMVAVQILFETLLIGIIGFVAAICISNNTTPAFSEMLLQQTETPVETVAENEAGIVFGGHEKVAATKPTKELQVQSLDTNSLLKTGASNFLVILLATFLPVTWILRKNPKKIMLMEE